MSAMLPTLHKPVPMGSRVIIPEQFLKKDNVMGVVAGIAFVHVIFGYIVILDEPVETEYGTQKAIVVSGSELRGVNGEDWRLQAD